MPSNQRQIIEQTKFTYSPLGKAFEKQGKKNQRSRNKTSWSFKSFKTRGSFKSFKSGENPELEWNEELFQRIWELMKSKMK